jgi:hypothetical protein
VTVDIGSDRAEDLSRDKLLELFVDSGTDSTILQHLMSAGTDLVQGSRGTGKTMLLRVAYERLRAERPDVLPVFLSFSRYLATTNPSSGSRDYSPFQSWVIAKLLQRLHLEAQPDNLQERVGNVPLARYIDRLESHYRDPSVSNRSASAEVLGVEEADLVEFDRLDGLVPHIHQVLDKIGRGSVTFLLDEATQNFAEELQPQFFRIVRNLRDARVAVKIAVYPQATVYGREFDIGHDARVLPIERDVEDSDAIPFFLELLQRRISESELWATLSENITLRDFFIRMSGGNPRWLLHLISRLPSERGEMTPSLVLQLAKEFPDTTLWPYLAGLKTRLITKRRYVENAIALARIFIEDLRQLNDGARGRARPTPYVAVSQSREIPFRVRAALGLLEYSGLVYRRSPRRITARENAQSYLIHPALLVKENCLYPSEANPSVDSLARALTDPPKDVFKEYTRNSPRLLSDLVAEETQELCDECGSVLPEGAKFCPACGNSVSKHSLYEELRSASSEELELTPGVKQRLIADGRFPTVGSVLDASDQEVDEIPYVGDVRVRFIKSAAEEFVAG